MNAPNPNNRPPVMRAAAPAAFVPKFSSGVKLGPPRIIVHGDSGLGKTTLVADAPKPAFVDFENGTGAFDVMRNDEPVTTWDQLIAVVRWFTTGDHDRMTLAFETLEHMEALAWEHLCAKERVDSIEKVSKGYGKGYRATAELFRVLVKDLETLRKTRGMGVVFVSHSKLVKQKSDVEEFDRWHIATHEYVRDLLYQQCDAVLFARKEVFTRTAESGRVKGVEGDKKVYLETVGAAGWFAKNRYNLPARMEMPWPCAHPWAPLAEGIRKGGNAVVASLRTELADGIARLATLDADAGAKAQAALGAADIDPEALSALLGRVNAGITQREAAAEAG